MIWNIIIYIIIFFGLYNTIFLLLTFFENKYKLKNPEVKKFYTISIIIPAYNESKNISRAIESLLNIDYPRDKLKIIVIDDGSKDNTYEVAKRYENRNVIVLTKPNSGKANSLNYVLKKVDTELVGCLDADSYADTNSLKNMVGYFDKLNVMAVIPSIKIGGSKSFLQKLQRIEYLMAVYLRKVFAYLNSIYIAPGPLSIYRKSFFDKYGGWDENTVTEDLELALRIQSKNFIIENSINANVYTIAPKTFKQLFHQRVRWYFGLMNNVIKYKYLFSRRYGNLGMFILPSSFVFVIFSILVFFYLIYNLANASLDYIFNLSSVNLQFTPFLKIILKENSYFYTNIFFVSTIIMILFGFISLYLAKRYSEEFEKIGMFYIFYILIYWELFAFWWLIAGIYKFFSINVKWGGINGKT